jgi:hypothetical protein
MKGAPNELVRQTPHYTEHDCMYTRHRQLGSSRGQGQNYTRGEDKKERSSVQTHPHHLDILFFKTKSLLIRFSHYFLFEEHIND